jgi:hypothetical protein
MRKYYLDNIRWMTVILVVVYHVIYMYNAEGILGGIGQITNLQAQYYDLYQYVVYPWFMPILFIVSGVCSRFYLKRHRDREFIRSRTRKLLVPSTIGLFAFQFVQGYISMAISDAFDTMTAVPALIKYLIMAVSGIGVLWYIQILWVFSVLLVLVRRIEKGRLDAICEKVGLPALLLMTFPLWGAAQIGNTPVIVVYRFGFYGLLFLLGYFVFFRDSVVNVLKKYFVPLLIAACGLCAAFCIRYFGENFADAPVNRSLLYVSFSWITCLAIFGGVAKYGDFETGFTRWMGRHNFGLYVFHYLGISAVALYFGKSEMLPAPATYLLSLIAGFAAGYLLNAIISRLPFFRWAVLGIRKGKENVQG